jgi:hypothetical protein
MSRETSVDERTAAINMAFEDAPRQQLPAQVQQIVMDERPQGAISVNVKRDERAIFQKIKTIATAAGDDFFYSWPTKNKDGTKGVVEGPSVKCANAVARLFGNCSVKVRVFDQGAHWILYAQFYDFETGFVMERPYQQRKNQKTGMGDADRQLDIVFQIGTSKAARNVVCNALSEFTDYAFAVAKEQLVEKIGKRLEFYREKVAAALVDLKVELVRVEQIRGKTIANWLAADVAKVIAEIQTVNDGMMHPDELWPPAGAEAGAAKPQAADYKPEGESGGKPADQGKPAAAQAETGKAAAAEAPKAEGAPAASQAPPAAQTADDKAQPPAQAQETPPAAQEQPQDPADKSEAQVAGELADAAREHGEAVVARGIDNLANLRTVEDIDKAAPSITEILKEIENLDPEDLSLLANRWKTARLERKREITRKKGR